MDSTIITILIAIAVIAFQVFGEKKKKEMQRQRQNRSDNPDISPQVQRDPREELRRDLESLFGSSTTIFEDDEQDPYLPALDTADNPLDTLPPETPEYTFQPLDTDQRAQSEQIDVTGDLYISKEISDFEGTAEKDHKHTVAGEDFDQRLFIIYSQLAKPKFEE